MRFVIAALAAGLALAHAPALAQDTAAPATNTSEPPPETVGPRELRDFTINGTVTRPAEAPPAVTAPAPTAPAPRSATPAPQPRAAPERPAAAAAREAPAPAPSVTVALPAADSLLDSPTPAPSDFASEPAAPGFSPSAPSDGELTDDQTGNFLPWLLALALLGAGVGFYAWRQRSQPSYATAGGLSEYAAAPAPAAEPLQRAPAAYPPQRAAAPRPAPAMPGGIVSTRMRPWLEIEFSPGRCVVEDDKATIQFDVSVFNSGSAPAREVLIEASMFNAGPAQDQEIGAFFEHPVAKGDRIPAIPPLKRVALKSAVSLTRAQLRQFEVGGRRLFVPLIGFNALYRWSGGDGQTSASYLVGRDTKSDKMAPLRLDLGPRIFRGLGARQHNVAVRK